MGAWNPPLRGGKWSLTATEAGRCWTALLLLQMLVPCVRNTLNNGHDGRIVEYGLQRPAVCREVREGVRLHLNPPDRVLYSLVLCVDEKSQVEALNRAQPILP